MDNYTIETEYVWSGARALWVAHLQLTIATDECGHLPWEVQSTTHLVDEKLQASWGSTDWRRISCGDECRSRSQEFTAESLEDLEVEVERAVAKIRDTIESIVINNRANAAIASSRGQKRSYSW